MFVQNKKHIVFIHPGPEEELHVFQTGWYLKIEIFFFFYKQMHA